MVFTLFHGQSLAEWGFSVNAEVLDHSSVTEGKSVSSFKVTKDLMNYCRSAKNRYSCDLEARKDKNGGGSVNDAEKNKALLAAECRKVIAFEKNTKKIKDEADVIALKAHRQNKLELGSPSNLKRKRLLDL